MKITLLLIFFLTNNTLYEDNNRSTVSYYYNGTQCADPWGTWYTIEENKAQLKSFLTKQKIEWKSIRIKVDTSLEEVCEGCGCTNGLTYYVTVKKRFSEKIENIGFKRTE